MAASVFEDPDMGARWQGPAEGVKPWPEAEARVRSAPTTRGRTSPMEFKSGPIKLSVGPRPRDPAADRAALQAIETALDAEDFAGAVAKARAALADGLEHPMVFNLAAER